jgi:4-amino-4-deoxy-L-arabinose transferase-like glycosyltransferase
MAESIVTFKQAFLKLPFKGVKASLFGIMLLGLVLRLSVFAGIAAYDDLWYIQSALQIINGEKLVINHWTTRLGIILPAAVALKVFGISEWSVIVYPLILSIAQIGLVYLMGLFLFDQTIALLSAFLIATFPPDVVWSTALMGDIPGAFWLGVSVYLFLRALKGGTQANVHYVLLASGLALGVGYLTKEIVIFILLAKAFWLVQNRWLIKWQNLFSWGIGIAIPFLVELFLLHCVTGNPLARIEAQLAFRHSTTSQGMSLLTYIAYYMRLLTPLSDGYILYILFLFSVTYLWRRHLLSDVSCPLVWIIAVGVPPILYVASIFPIKTLIGIEPRIWFPINYPLALITAYGLKQGVSDLRAMRPKCLWLLWTAAVTSILVFVASFPVSGYVAKLLRHLVSPTTWWTKGDRYLQAVKDGTVFLGLSALLVFFLALWVILRERFTTNLPSIGSIRLPLFAVGLLLTVYTVIHLALMGGIGATDEKQVMGFLLTRAIGRDIIYSDMRTIATLSFYIVSTTILAPLGALVL